MCAWWTGQPGYGSNAVSKFVRENFAWLKALVDAHEVRLAGITADAGEINILDGATITTAQLNSIPSLANSQIKSMRLTYAATSAFGGTLTLTSNFFGDAKTAVAITEGYNGANFAVSASAAVCTITIKDATISGTIQGVLGVITVCGTNAGGDEVIATISGSDIVLHVGSLISGHSTANVLAGVWNTGGHLFVNDILYVAY